MKSILGKSQDDHSRIPTISIFSSILVVVIVLGLLTKGERTYAANIDMTNAAAQGGVASSLLARLATLIEQLRMLQAQIHGTVPVVPTHASALAQGGPMLVEPGSLGPTAVRIGDAVALYGKNVFATTRVKFSGNVWSTSVREYKGAASPTGPIKDRILATVPKGAHDGVVTVCNGDICEVTASSLIIVPPLNENASIALIAPDKPMVYRIGDTVDVRYLVRNWNSPGFAGNIYVTLEKEHTSSSLLVGKTANTSRYSFVLGGDNYTLGTGQDVFRVRVCNMWQEVCDESDRPFSVIE